MWQSEMATLSHPPTRGSHDEAKWEYDSKQLSIFSKDKPEALQSKWARRTVEATEENNKKANTDRN